MQSAARSSLTRVLVAVTGVVCVAAVATADELGTGDIAVDTGKPVVETLLDIMRASGQINEEQHAALLERARAEEAAATAAAATPVAVAEPPEPSKPGVKVSTGWNGLKVESPEGAFKFRLGGRIQADWAVFAQDISPMGDGVELRRARIAARGTLWHDWNYKLQVNFDPDGAVEINDAFLSYTGFAPFHITAGHQKVPFSQQSMTSSNWQVFQERALLDTFIDSDQTGRRRLGIALGGYGDHWMLNAGFFGEGVDDTGKLNENWGVAARALWAPVNDERKHLHVGGSIYYRNTARSNTDLRFASKPEANIAGTRMVDTGILAFADDALLYNAEISGFYGPFHAQAEYTGVNVGRRAMPGLNFNGFYVQAGYFLTGESRRYDMRLGQYKRIVPKEYIGKNGWSRLGAWEIAARYSYIDLISQDIRGGQQHDVTAGLNWWITPSIMFRFNYVWANAFPNSARVLQGLDEYVNVFEGRAQVVF